MRARPAGHEGLLEPTGRDRQGARPPSGWLRTGDIARIDEKGFVYIVDRKKDMILVSGFNVYPNEIEDVVAQMPGVLEVAAVGVPDEKSGEAVKLVVVRKDPTLTEEAIRAHCKANLTGYKLPHVHRVPRFAAEDQCRQDPAPRTARRPGVAGSRRSLTVPCREPGVGYPEYGSSRSA